MVIGGRALLGRLLLALEDAGAAVRTETALTALVVEHGEVVGLEVATPDGLRRIHVGRGVLLAAGGFERNEELRRRHQPVGAAYSLGAPGGTGDALCCGIEVGAATDLLDESWWSPGFLLPDGTAGFRLYERGRPGALVVNAAGERFANETLPYDQFGHAMLEGERTGVRHLPSWFVCDRRFLDRYVYCGIEPGAPIPDEWFDTGALVQAPSVEELEARLGLPSASLVRTIAEFNGFARRGVDVRFHRGESEYDRFFGDPDHGPNPCLGELIQPPFYAAVMVLSDLGTKGGLRCDEHARVLDESGRPIGGLYAAGNTMASVMGGAYPGPGCPIGSSMTFGYLAALDMAARP
jgi:3-oxosteroid 1-dehydrogenase